LRRLLIVFLDVLIVFLDDKTYLQRSHLSDRYSQYARTPKRPSIKQQRRRRCWQPPKHKHARKRRLATVFPEKY
jgi:hypothetical protein